MLPSYFNQYEKREKMSLFRCHGFQVWFSRDEAPNDTSTRDDLDLWLSSNDTNILRFYAKSFRFSHTNEK